jgi:hypothetical protein
MAIICCHACGSTIWSSVTVDDDGTEAICEAGHYNVEAADPTCSVRAGHVETTGQAAIGSASPI